jgi:hypothetical protein
MTLSVALNIQPIREAGNIELERMWKRAEECTAVSVHTVKAYAGSGSMTPIIFNLGTRRDGQHHAPTALPLGKK